jgi:hypothetical protein
MGESSRATVEAPAGPDGRLRELCAAVAEARRRIANGGAEAAPLLPTRLVTLLAGLPAAMAGGRGDPGALISLLDEVAGLAGQLELEREAVHAQMAAADRHRRAGRSYAGAGARRRP